jgi:hypothetical protein
MRREPRTLAEPSTVKAPVRGSVACQVAAVVGLLAWRSAQLTAFATPRPPANVTAPVVLEVLSVVPLETRVAQATSPVTWVELQATSLVTTTLDPT